MLDRDEADDVLAVAGQALRGAVRHIAELIDRGAHPRTGVSPHGVLSVQDPGHRCDRDARVPRDVIERYHAVTYP